MTNKEKFKEIFGIEPDCGHCNPYPCEENDCKYWEQCENQPGCPCDNWWDWEFEDPTTKNDLAVDCISRADAIKAMQDKAKKLKNEDTINGLCGAVSILFDMPLVTPQEPRKGHWIGHREHCENLGVMPSGLGAYEWCSNCECGIDVREWHRNHYNYCPNCGAKMVESQESEE